MSKGLMILNGFLILMLLGIIDTRLTDHAIARGLVGMVHDGVAGLIPIVFGPINQLLREPAMKEVGNLIGVVLVLVLVFKFLGPSMYRAMTYTPPKKEEKKHH